MPLPAQLPPSLAEGPFSTSAALALGLPAGRLRRADLRHPTRGAHCRVAPGGLSELAAAFAVGLGDGAAFSHVTAALLWGLPLPADLEQRIGLDVITRSDAGQVHRAGCRGHRGVERREVVDLGGLRVVGLADTWCDLGDLGRRRLDVDDLVVAGDAAATRINSIANRPRRDPGGTAALVQALRRRVRPRGAVALRAAAALVRPGVRSPQESRTRLMFVRAGLPEPEVNVPITDRGGEFIGEGDLVWREARVVVEYQGGDHAERRRRSADAFRRDCVHDEGWTVHEVWAEDLRLRPRQRALLVRVARSIGVDPGSLVLP